jgi:hypothetical protein
MPGTDGLKQTGVGAERRTRLSAAERMQTVVAVLNELDQFNNSVTLFSEKMDFAATLVQRTGRGLPHEHDLPGAEVCVIMNCWKRPCEVGWASCSKPGRGAWR